MNFRKITAIIRAECLEKVELALQAHGQPGMSVTRVKGYGELRNPFREDWMEGHARVELFVDADRVDVLVEAIIDAAHIGLAGDGIVAVLPVEAVYRVRDKRLLEDDD